jgi:3-hydroxybutyryl-CoA dehydrogenase
MTKQVLIAGEAPFVDLLAERCTAKNHQVYLFHIEELDEQGRLDDLVNLAAVCDVFIESLNESTASKLWLIEGIEANLRKNALVLSNTLCASPTEVASWCSHPQRLVGFGFVPPLGPHYPIEFAPALQSEVQMAVAAREFWQRMDFEVLRVADTPGLVRARLLAGLINEAVFSLDEKIASAEDIDTALKHLYKLPLGPLAWADMLGLDVVLGILMGLYDFWHDARYRPAPLLKQKVRAKHLGTKVGRGFFLDPLVNPPNS